MNAYDLIIVGAGPAGSALAMQLAGAGYRVALLDRGRFPRDKVCGDLVSARGLDLLDQLGCLEPLSAAARVPITGARVYLNGRWLATGPMPRVPGLPAHGLAIRRLELDDLLFRRAQQAGADTLEDCRIESFEYSRNGVVVAGCQGGKPVRLSGRMIVGADGAQSVVAEIAGLAMTDSRYLLPAVRAYVEGFPLDHAVLCFDEEFFPGYAWVFPLADGICNIGVGMVRETLKRHRLALPAFLQRLRRFVEHLAAEYGCRIHIHKSAGWVIKAFGAGRRTVFDRGLLVGEAGCFVDPMTGEGIPLALATARMASEAIVDAFAAGDFGDASLMGYERRWRSGHETDLRIADLVVSLARNRDLLPYWLNTLRCMALTAGRDERYALTLGGIMAGLVPAREGLSSAIVLRSLLHAPDSWLEILGLQTGQRSSFADFAVGLPKWAAEQAHIGRGILADPSWSARWAGEVLAKSMRLTGKLRSATGVRDDAPAVGPVRVRPRRVTEPPVHRNVSGKAVVFGATGHIGSAVVRELLRRGWEVSAVSRRAEPPVNLDGLPLRFVHVAGTDGAWPEHFERCVPGHDLVVDAAAPYPIDLFPRGDGGRRRLYRGVGDRTSALVASVRRQGASLAYIGSFVTTPRREPDLARRLGSASRRWVHPYFEVKRSIELRIRAEQQAGLKAVIVNPTVCIGPWDLKPRGYCLIPQLARGEVPGLIRHEVNVIDVRDVAYAVGAAVDAGCYGKVIPLSGHNLSIDALVRRVCQLSGPVAPPDVRLDATTALSGAVAAEAVLSLFGRASPSPALATILATESFWTSPGSEQSNLGAHPRALSNTLIDAIDWYRTLGYC